MAVKRDAVEGAKKMSKKSISRAPAKKTASHKQTVTEADLQQLRRKGNGISGSFVNGYEQSRRV